MKTYSIKFSILAAFSVMVSSSCDDGSFDSSEDDAISSIDEKSGQTHQGVEEIQNPLGVAKSALPAGGCAPGSIDLGVCYWAEATTSQPFGTYIQKASCSSAGYIVISGGCYTDSSTARLLRSNPFENGGSIDLPENECMQDLSGVTGWGCEVNQTATGTISARALCCSQT